MRLQLCFLLCRGESGDIKVVKTDGPHHPDQGNGKDYFKEGKSSAYHGISVYLFENNDSQSICHSTRAICIAQCSILGCIGSKSGSVSYIDRQ